jgi:hypothetical protein
MRKNASPIEALPSTSIASDIGPAFVGKTDKLRSTLHFDAHTR